MVSAAARPLSLVAKTLLLVTLVAVLAACGRSPGRHAIPGDNDPHPGVNRARALPIQGLDVARYQGRIDFHKARAGGTYAQLPFFNLMNVSDVFASLVLRPHRVVTIRSDVHWLRLGDRHDLWYSGGGAQSEDIFGFTGTPSSGHRALAYLVDLSASVAATTWLTLAGYYGHAFGGDVVGGTFDGRGADYGFLEMTLRY